MSNQFYNYIVEILVNYFSNNYTKPGDRYYLQLERADEVEALVAAFSNLETTQPFQYQHELGDPYETIFIQLHEVKLVIAYTSDQVKPDFLVTLRNEVGKQSGVWENTALLSIVNSQLDSIQGGSSDLQKEGMPLHPSSIIKKLKEDIENNHTFSKVEKIILLDRMDQIVQEQQYQQITFFEFEDIFTVLRKGRIEDQDYKKFALFKDSELDTVTGKELKKRLELNRELFDFIRKNHEYGFDEDQLEKMLSPTGISKVKNDNWEDISFSHILKYHNEAKSLNKEKVTLTDLSVKNNLMLWDRPQKETAAGSRKRHIIIFNPNNFEEVELTASFSIQGKNSKSLLDEYIKVPKKYNSITNYSVEKHNLTVKIKTNPNDVSFTKVSYHHNGKSTLGADLFIAVVPTEPVIFDFLKTSYMVDPKEEAICTIYNGMEFQIGQGLQKDSIKIESQEQTIDFDVDKQLTIYPQPEIFNDDNQIKIYLSIKDHQVKIPLLLINEFTESTKKLTSFDIWKLKRRSKQNFIFQNNKLLLGNNEFSVTNDSKQFYEWELEWVNGNLKCAKLDSNELTPVELKLSNELEEAYNEFVLYFNSLQNIPSFCFYSQELKKAAEKYVNTYNQEISKFKEGHAAGNKGRDLFKLGTLISNQGLYITPFHPLMVSFQLQIYNELQQEEVNDNILTRLRPDALLPFIYDENDELFKPFPQNSAFEWILYKPVQQVSISDSNKYLARIINDKIEQFQEHFSYLFNAKSKTPIKVNVINIKNDHEVTRGILNWMLKTLKNKGFDFITPIEVSLYNNHLYESSFDKFSKIETIDQFQEIFDLDLCKGHDYDPHDVLRIIRNNLRYYKHSLSDEFEYAHISFFKMLAQEKHAILPMSDMTTGMNLHGLHSYVPSLKGTENYRSGFGTKYYPRQEMNLLVETAIYVNELCANLRNGGNDSYQKNVSIVSRTTTADEQFIDRIFKSSHWVTFVDSNVDLEFFNDYGKNLLVIHYSDQYSSSNRYDAITVTDKTDQYYSVIKEFLTTKNVEATDRDIKSAIKAFNVFNGEWLLRIIGSKGHYSREKLSIISAIKFCLAYFYNERITWVPVSLEEILRVAGAVRLNKSDGIFTAKNLGVKGAHSDDLLLIGLENQNNKLVMHFYPVEVKIGVKSSDVLEKAKFQVKQTKQLIDQSLNKNHYKPFTAKFYRNFFVQLFLMNANKLQKSNLWPERNFSISDEVIEKLLADDFELSSKINTLIGKGAVLSFQKNTYFRSSSLIDDITFIHLPEHDGYNGLIKSMNEMYSWIQEKDNDFVKENLLSNLYDSNVKDHTVNEKSEPRLPENQSAKEYDNKNQDYIHKSTPNYLSLSPYVSNEPRPNTKSNQWRILIGRAENSNRKIYWEYGNSGLANRHLLISGKSGQGKTYFMQCLLLEMSKMGISSIIVDYTEGFLPNQLEPEFKEFLGSKLIQRIVFNDKLPINPFRKNIRDIGGITLPESNTDVAERIKSVFASVYNSLGIQQLNAIYEAVLKGFEQYGDEMNLRTLKAVLEEEQSSYAKTALSQIKPFIDRDPFGNEDTLQWSDILNSDGNVFIIQLTGYPRDVQLIITEFILWDLWNYSVRHGNKHHSIPVLLDEAQNLDHSEKSPSAKILTEGRKFGWSGWYATQFLKSQLGADEIARLQNATQKVYFAQPEQEISYISNNLSSDPSEKKMYEAKLAALKKGQCIVHGPILKEDGELSKPVATVVNIIPLSERLG